MDFLGFKILTSKLFPQVAGQLFPFKILAFAEVVVVVNVVVVVVAVVVIDKVKAMHFLLLLMLFCFNGF